jgi:hypothetical protein
VNDVEVDGKAWVATGYTGNDTLTMYEWSVSSATSLLKCGVRPRKPRVRVALATSRTATTVAVLVPIVGKDHRPSVATRVGFRVALIMRSRNATSDPSMKTGAVLGDSGAGSLAFCRESADLL